MTVYNICIKLDFKSAAKSMANVAGTSSGNQGWFLFVWNIFLGRNNR